MIRNYFKVAFRNLYRQGAYSLINIIGLSVGIASFLLIVLYVQYELSFDNQARNSQNLYRVVEIQNHEGVGEQHVAFTPGPMLQAMVDNTPEVINGFRFMGWGTIPVKIGEHFFQQKNVTFTDPDIIYSLNIELLYGDTATALNEARSVVLSESSAIKMFGDAASAMNQIIDLQGYSGFKVSGVMKDFPETSHLKAGMLIPFKTIEEEFEWIRGWGSNCTAAYIRLAEGTDPIMLGNKFTEYIAERFMEKNDNPYSVYLQDFNKIHLQSSHIKFQTNYNMGNISNIYIFGAIAILVLIIACINYINLSIARSVKRAREVGMRKVLGASRMNLTRQFLGESLLLVLASVIIAVMMVELLVPFFNQLLNTHIELSYTSNHFFMMVIPALWILVSLISGSYPAFYLSSYEAASVLKSGSGRSANSGGWLSKGLVIFQFTVSVVLIITILVVQSQISFMREKDPGFNYHNVAGVPLYGDDEEEDMDNIAAEISKNADITDYCFASGFNGASGNQSTLSIDDTVQSKIMMRIGFIDPNFLKTMEIPIVKGRNFSSESDWDKKNSVILNQAAVDYLGWENPIGKKFQNYYDDSLPSLSVIGVIADYNYYSMHNPIEPAAFLWHPESFTDLLVRYHPEKQDAVKKYTENIWADLFPGKIMNYMIINDLVNKQYQKEANSLLLFSYFTLLSILISCMGLFGLTSLITEQRTKEVGIRKALGGSTYSVSMLMVKYFIRLVAISGIIAIPFGYIIANDFLNHFAFKITLGAHYFIISLLIALVIAFLTIIIKVFAVANSNPVHALRYE